MSRACGCNESHVEDVRSVLHPTVRAAITRRSIRSRPCTDGVESRVLDVRGHPPVRLVGGEDPGLPCDGLRTATFTSRMCIGRIGSIKLRFVSGQRRRGEPSLPSMRDAPLPEGRHRARMAPASPGSQQVTRAARQVDRAGRHRGRRHPPEAPRPPPSRPGHRTARAHLSVSAPLQIVFRRTSSARVACLRRKARARLPAPPSER